MQSDLELFFPNLRANIWWRQMKQLVCSTITAVEDYQSSFCLAFSSCFAKLKQGSRCSIRTVEYEKLWSETSCGADVAKHGDIFFPKLSHQSLFLQHKIQSHGTATGHRNIIVLSPSKSFPFIFIRSPTAKCQPTLIQLSYNEHSVPGLIGYDCWSHCEGKLLFIWQLPWVKGGRQSPW